MPAPVVELSRALTDGAEHAFAAAQGWVFEVLLQPAMLALGLDNLLEDGLRGAGWLVAGLAQIAVMLGVIGALERRWPVEPVVDRAAVRTDVVYTLIHRLGVFRVALFLAVDPLWDRLRGQASLAGFAPFDLDRWLVGPDGRPWPALAVFAAYVVALDFVEYWLHRAQHRVGWWWQLHALHHSQRQMTMWSDDRNHLLDSLIVDAALVATAFAIGVPPGQFVAATALARLVESLAHANTRVGFGRLGSRLLVGPAYHREHHALGHGEQDAGRPGRPGGANFATLLPLWDVLFGTARFDTAPRPTGIADQLAGRDYGRGFVAQQWLGLKRLVGRG